MAGFDTVDDPKPEDTDLAAESSFKRLFAAALLRSPSNSYKAALEVFTNTQMASRVANTWPFDPEVIEFKKELLETHGAERYMPEKSSLASLVWERLEKEPDNETFIKLSDHYAKLRGFYPQKQGSTTSINVNSNNQEVVQTSNVLIVKTANTDEEWEQKAITQQRGLTQGD